MKKNSTMRVAALLLALTLMTSCFVGGTFAKYTTAETGTDSARVAKWGVQIISNGKMFGEHYYAHDNDTASVAYTGSVDSQGEIPGGGEKQIVAPGTKGDMVEVDLYGKPEVKVQVSYAATLTLDGWEVDSAEYCPIVITVNGEKYGIGAHLPGVTLQHDCASIAQLKSEIQLAVAGYTTTYNAGTNLEDVAYEALSISWEWPFSTSEENDIKDTKLGNATAAGNPAVIEISVKTTVTQVD